MTDTAAADDRPPPRAPARRLPQLIRLLDLPLAELRSIEPDEARRVGYIARERHRHPRPRW